MKLEMLLQMKFDRAIMPEECLKIGSFKMTVNGMAVEFEFGEQTFYIDIHDPSVVLFKLSSMHSNKEVTVEDLKDISSIDECSIYTGECKESGFAAAAIRQILFAVSKPRRCTISAKNEVIKIYNQRICLAQDVVEAAFTSVWDNTAVTTPCKVNLQTKEVFDIELSTVELVGSCEREFVTIGGKEFPVHGDHNLTNEEDEYWYGAESAQFMRLDSWDRPVYELSDGKLIKDVNPRLNSEPDLYYSSNNDIDGEPDCPVKMTVKLLPKRVTWENSREGGKTYA